ncbi:hypothetical protein M422DRAFT_32887 [Sphaerobolus stellatus SS14]|uniref:Uncharacterized protein n=1 Tax=Sphaerobolus stellatus (strain SS14) TaxID=990650 RepID=A0A0C9VMV6_SPHS4|nr:hypothetical protein M422DRAFT_32887 [Sphaerobolus stellatus SS14]
MQIVEREWNGAGNPFAHQSPVIHLSGIPIPASSIPNWIIYMFFEVADSTTFPWSTLHYENMNSFGMSAPG